jgi:hypothetical protein
LGQIQSETPYYQAGQLISDKPFTPGQSIFPDDPDFGFCSGGNLPSPNALRNPSDLALASGPSGFGFRKHAIDTCREAWALRIIDSSHVYLYGGGFYSFFNDYKDTCGKTGKACQDRLIDIDFSEEIWIYGLYTVGSQEVISPQGKE